MARPLRINYSGAFYHVTSRGNERKNVFKSKGNNAYDFMRFNQLAPTDSLLQFFDLSWMNDSLLIGLYLAFFQSRWLSCQAFYTPKNIKDFVL